MVIKDLLKLQWWADCPELICGWILFCLLMFVQPHRLKGNRLSKDYKKAWFRSGWKPLIFSIIAICLSNPGQILSEVTFMMIRDVPWKDQNRANKNSEKPNRWYLGPTIHHCVQRSGLWSHFNCDDQAWIFNHKKFPPHLFIWRSWTPVALNVFEIADLNPTHNNCFVQLQTTASNLLFVFQPAVINSNFPTSCNMLTTGQCSSRELKHVTICNGL